MLSRKCRNPQHRQECLCNQVGTRWGRDGTSSYRRRRIGRKRGGLATGRARRAVTLYEMRPVCATPAHKTDQLAELVCSNSLKSNAPGSASWPLKEELRRAGSLLMRVAGECAVPGEQLWPWIASALPKADRRHYRSSAHHLAAGRTSPNSCGRADADRTGPLTSDALAARLQALTGSEHLAFYDSISPVVDAETLNMERIFRASRYGKGGEDYLNCPFNEDEYRIFHEALDERGERAGARVRDVQFFEACLPIEELARRGYDTLRFGPMKPVGSLIRASAANLLPSCNCGRKTCAFPATTWWAFRTT